MSNVSFGEYARFQCTCGQPIYFRNSVCLKCNSALGYDPQTLQLYTLVPDNLEQKHPVQNQTEPFFTVAQTQQQVKRCANFDSCSCNWLLPADADNRLCISCRLTRTIPDLSIEKNQQRLSKIELAKRRLIAQLLALELPLPDRNENPTNGLVFDLLGKDEKGNMPLTGHASGLITINVHEADDDYRTQVRTNMEEHYRTMLGHFRHEIGHFYWDILVRDSVGLERFRTVFGDERASYAEALDHHYKNGAPANWQESYISAYATMHPWEDWAETWAHYLHMMDTLNTATAFGIQLAETRFDLKPFTKKALYAPRDREAEHFLVIINQWVELVAMLNALSRSIGQLDLYPFILSAPVVAKLQFVHLVVRYHGHPPALETFDLEASEE